MVGHGPASFGDGGKAGVNHEIKSRLIMYAFGPDVGLDADDLGSLLRRKFVERARISISELQRAKFTLPASAVLMGIVLNEIEIARNAGAEDDLEATLQCFF